MYIINEYQLIETASTNFINHKSKGAKLSSEVLSKLLLDLQQQPLLEISEQQLIALAAKYNLDYQQMLDVLMSQLGIVKPAQSRKFKRVYINSDDDLIADIMQQSFSRQYKVELVGPDFNDYKANSLIICYRLNYSHSDFKRLYQNLTEEVYVITAGVIHQLLIIDNLYFKGSGLPSHFSNLQQLLTYLNSDIPATKNNWLLFYRSLLKNRSEGLPDAMINSAQRAYCAYALFRFASQLTDLWAQPMPFDQANWMWHVDLNEFSLHKEVALHSPFSEYDMDINLAATSALCEELA